MVKKLVVMCVLVLMAVPALAQMDHGAHGGEPMDEQAPALVAFSDAWMPADADAAPRPVYFTLHNLTDGALRLVGAQTPDAETAQVQRLSESYGSTTARRVREIEIGAGAMMMIAAPDYQIGLSNLTRELTAGDAITLTLMLEDEAGTMISATIGVPVLQTAPPPSRLLIADAWARPADNGTVSGAYMQLVNTSDEDAVIVGAEMALAGVVEIHETVMENEIMRMNPIPELVIPAGETGVLEPGANHIMLMDLQAALVEGSAVTITVTFDDGDQQVIGVPIYNRMMMDMMMGG